MRNVMLSEYASLIRNFVDAEIDGSSFESQYLATFKSDATIHSEEVFSALDTLFAAVDAFVADLELREEGDLDEQQLREKATDTYRKLQALGSGT